MIDINNKGLTSNTREYLMRSLPQVSDFFSKNLTISNVVLDENTNELTITTNEEHKLAANDYVYLEKFYYTQPITSFKSDTTLINRLQTPVYAIETTYDTTFIVNTFETILLKDFTDTSLNKEFFILKTELKKAENKMTLYGYFYDDDTINATDITGEGTLCYLIRDEFFLKEGVANPSYYGSMGYIAGAYNGLKYVKSVTNVNTFVVLLHDNQNIIIPPYKPIYFNEAILKTNIGIFTVANLDTNEEEFVNRLKENEDKGVLLLTRSLSDTEYNGVSANAQETSIGHGITNFFAKKPVSFEASIIFRVHRRNAEHFVIGDKANDIADAFDSALESILGRSFYDLKTNFQDVRSVETLYQSVYNNMQSVEPISNTKDTVFCRVRFGFRITKYVSQYNKFTINRVGVPVKRIESSVNYNGEEDRGIVNE